MERHTVLVPLDNKVRIGDRLQTGLEVRRLEFDALLKRRWLSSVGYRCLGVEATYQRLHRLEELRCVVLAFWCFFWLNLRRFEFLEKEEHQWLELRGLQFPLAKKASTLR